MIEVTELANTLYTAVIAGYGVELLKGVGINFTYDKLKHSDKLKKISQKTIDFLKGKEEAHKEVKLLKHAVNEQDKEDFKEQSETVKEILKMTLEDHPDFKKEIENILNGLDGETKNELSKATQHITIQNSKNVIAGNTFGNISGGMQIGDNSGNKNEK